MAKFVKTNFYGSAQFSIWGGPQYSQDYSFSGDANFTDAYSKKERASPKDTLRKVQYFAMLFLMDPHILLKAKSLIEEYLQIQYSKDSSRFILYNFGTSTDFKEAKIFD